MGRQLWWADQPFWQPSTQLLLSFFSYVLLLWKKNLSLVCSLLIHKIKICSLCGIFNMISMLSTTENAVTLKSGYPVGQGHWKLHQWFPCVSFPILVINCTRGRILCCLWDIAFNRSTIALFCCPLLRLTPPMKGFPWDDLHKILYWSEHGQGTQQWRNIEM